MPTLDIVGRVANFFARASIASIDLTDSLQVGDAIYIKGQTTDMRQLVESPPINRTPVKGAHAGESVGVQVGSRCRKRDVVYRLGL